MADQLTEEKCPTTLHAGENKFCPHTKNKSGSLPDWPWPPAARPRSRFFGI